MKRNLKIATAVLLTITAAILCVAILITMINRSKRELLLSSTHDDVSSCVETTVSEESDTQNSSEALTSSNPQPTTTSKPTTSSSNQSSSSNNSVGITIKGPDADKVRHPISGLPFKQIADHETGISWDGVSPIIYTYPDGTTGTEKRDGATYEYLPGWIETYKVPRDAIGRELGTICNECGKSVAVTSYGKSCSKNIRNLYCQCCGVYVNAYACHTCSFITDKVTYCSYCGKISGNGLNNTCLRYWGGGDHDCMWCGVNIPARTCHVCIKGCQYCGKPMGNGINGTCYRDYFGTSNCPSCGISVPINTCHSCG